MFAERVCDTGLVHDIRVLTRKVDHNDLRAENQVKNILYNRAFLPNVIHALRRAAVFLDQSAVDVSNQTPRQIFTANTGHSEKYIPARS